MPDYVSKGRSWVKLWVPEWLDGTSRYEMTSGQRAFWVDLLALAGRSRIPGFVCASDDPDALSGYPISRYKGIFGEEQIDILETFNLFVSQRKISLTCTRETDPKLYVVEILNWDKYQSEYMRQRKVRAKTRQGARNVTPKNTTRCGVEGEREREGEGETTSVTSFPRFWNLYPKKNAKPPAERSWKRLSEKDKTSCLEKLQNLTAGEWLSKDPQFIPNPATFLNQRRWEDETPQGTHQNQTERHRHANPEVLVGLGPCARCGIAHIGSCA